MNYKDHEIILNSRRIIIEEFSLDENGTPEDCLESWADDELSSWYSTPDIDRKFRTINGIKRAIDKLERDA